MADDAGSGQQANEGKDNLMARHGRQAGCLTRKGKVWIFRYREERFKADRSTLTVHRSVSFGAVNRQEATRLRDDYIRRHGLAGNRPKAAMTLNEFWGLYFEPQIVSKKRPNTQKLYAHLFRNHLSPYFGTMKLSDITRYDVQAFVTRKVREGYSPQTIAHLRECLSKALGTAVLWGWLDDNAAKGVTMPRMERQRAARVLSPDEIAKVIEALREPARTMFALGVLLGLRVGELLGLQASDVDLDAGILYVRRSVCRGEIGPTKTACSERRFPLPPMVTDLLRDYLAHRTVQSVWLFPTREGNCHNDRTLFVRYVAPVIGKLGIPHFSWHSMRHTFLTYNGNVGVAMPVLQSLAGHTNAQTTLRYMQAFTDQKRDAIEQWARELFPTVPACWQSGRNSDGQVAHSTR